MSEKTRALNRLIADINNIKIPASCLTVNHTWPDYCLVLYPNRAIHLSDVYNLNQLTDELQISYDKPIGSQKYCQVQNPSNTPNLLTITASVQSLSHVQLFAHQASLSITSSQSPPKPMSIELTMPSNHLILCHPLLLLPSTFPSIRVFSNESALCIGGQSIGVSASTSAKPDLHVLQTHQLTVRQNYPTQSLFYNKVLAISCNLLNTVLKGKNRCLLVY